MSDMTIMLLCIWIAAYATFGVIFALQVAEFCTSQGYSKARTVKWMLIVLFTWIIMWTFAFVNTAWINYRLRH